MVDVLQKLAESGIIGAVAALAIWHAYRERSENRKLYERMITMAEKTTERYHAAMEELSRTVSALSEYTDERDE